MKLNLKAQTDTSRNGKSKLSVTAKRQTKKTPLYVLLIFIVMQLAPAFFIAPTMGYFEGQGLEETTARMTTTGWLIVSSMGIGFVATIILVLRDKRFFDIWKGKKTSFPMAFLWGALGFLLLLVGQSLAVMIEMAIGIDPGSENTMALVSVAEVVPLTILAIVLFAPVLEELVFRRVIFGSLNQTTNFWVATAVSALAFGLVHMEMTHLLTYFSTGLVLAFLYQKTKRIITPIIAHVLLNGYVMAIQLNMDKIQGFLKELEKIQ